MRKGKKRWNRKKREKLKKWQKRESVKKSPSPSLSLSQNFKSEKFSRVSHTHPPNPPITSLFLFLSLSQNFFKQKKKMFSLRDLRRMREKKIKKVRIVSASFFFRRPHPHPKKNCHPGLFKFLLNFHCLSWGFPTLVSCFSSCRFSVLPLPQFLVLLPLLSSPHPPFWFPTLLFVCPHSFLSSLSLSSLVTWSGSVSVSVLVGACVLHTRPPTTSLSLSVANFSKKKKN